MVRARMQRIAGPVAGVLALACLGGLALRAGAAEQKDKKKLATLSGVIYRGDRQRAGGRCADCAFDGAGDAR